jgi:peptidoglycan/LPS O-acetylase OafA/YrhL
MNNEATRRLVLLDGLRGIAAIGVMCFHADFASIGPVFTRGYLYVDLFFLLSGFVITLAFEPRFGRDLAPLPFLRRRMRRFLPMLAAGAAVGFVAFLQNGGTTVAGLSAIAMSLAMVPVPLLAMPFPLNSPQWSLLLEIVGNAVHARWLHRMTQRGLLTLAGTCAAGLAVVAFHKGDIDLGVKLDEIPAAMLRLGWSYTLGVVLARHWQKRAQHGPAATMPRRIDWRLALLGPVVAVTAFAFAPVPHWIGDMLVVTLAFPTLFWIAACAMPPAWATRPLAALGAISFPLYAIHYPLLRVADSLGGDTGRALALPIAIALAAALAYASSAAGTLRRQSQAPTRAALNGALAGAPAEA